MGLQRACDTIGRVLVCGGVATIGGGVFMVMTDVSQHSAVTMEHVADWSTFFTQIVEGFLLPLAVTITLSTLICGRVVPTCG